MERVTKMLRDRQDLLIGLIIGVAAGWIISTAPGWLQASSHKNWWDIATAIGTIGTAFVAVLVPWWQNKDRLREQRKTAVLIDWAVAQDVHQISAKVRDAANKWLEKGTTPSGASSRYLHNQLEISKQRTIDSFGSLIIGGLLHITAMMLNAVESEDRARSSAQGSKFVLVQMLVSGLSDERQMELRRTGMLHDMTTQWMSRLLTQFERLGIDAPNVVRGEGRVEMRVEVGAK